MKMHFYTHQFMPQKLHDDDDYRRNKYSVKRTIYVRKIDTRKHTINGRPWYDFKSIGRKTFS